jgi:dGTPase
LKERFGREFRHYEHSLRVVDRLERDGAGLNLTQQVRDGIVSHSSRASLPQTLEGRIVRVIDRVAYINHDIDDAMRAGLLREEDLPGRPIAVLGATGSQRIDALVHDMVEHSAQMGDIVQGPVAGPAMAELRKFMFEHVYLGEAVRAEHARIANVVRKLFEHYVEHPELLPSNGVAGVSNSVVGTTAGGGTDSLEGVSGTPRDDVAQRVTDYVAGMTDRYCIREYTDLEVPRVFAR